jgi:hypothetical protein
VIIITINILLFLNVRDFRILCGKISIHNYTPLLLNRNDKNKLCKFGEISKKFKTRRDTYLGLWHQKPSRETVPLKKE